MSEQSWFMKNTLEDGTVQPSRDWTLGDFHKFMNYFFDGYIVASLDDQTFIVNEEMFEHRGWTWKVSPCPQCGKGNMFEYYDIPTEDDVCSDCD